MNTFLLLRLLRSGRLVLFVHLSTLLSSSQLRLSSAGLLQMAFVSTRAFLVGLFPVQFPFDLFHFYDERESDRSEKNADRKCTSFIVDFEILSDVLMLGVFNFPSPNIIIIELFIIG